MEHEIIGMASGESVPENEGCPREWPRGVSRAPECCGGKKTAPKSGKGFFVGKGVLLVKVFSEGWLFLEREIYLAIVERVPRVWGKKENPTIF